MDNHGGFSYSEYDVMDRSCNTFTYELAKRLELNEKYPLAILKQSKMGECLAPIAHALDNFVDFSGSGSGSAAAIEHEGEERPPSCFRKRHKDKSPTVKR